MNILLKIIMACALSLALYACGGKAVTPLPPSGTAPEMSKEEVIAAIRDKMPVSCAYAGKVRFYFTKGNTLNKMSAIVDKTCSGKISVKILGLFGAVYAEISADSEGYTVFEKGRNVTDELLDVVNAGDLELLKKCFSLPPPMPDESFSMFVQKDGYLFYSGEAVIVADFSYRVNRVLFPEYTIEYFWGDKTPESISLQREETVLNMEFIDRWKLK